MGDPVQLLWDDALRADLLEYLYCSYLSLLLVLDFALTTMNLSDETPCRRASVRPWTMSVC